VQHEAAGADLPCMRKLLLVVAFVALAIPATAPAKGSGGHKNAAKECKALRAQMGAEAFRSTFGGKRGKNALGRCVSTQRKAGRAARKRARRACRADGLRGQAMKRCVRSKLAEDPAPAPADYEHAVEECRDEQAEQPEEFAAEFGDGSNAFGKCVSHEVQDDEDDETEPEPEDGDGVESAPGDFEDSPLDEPDES
jgi:hypothetical protein